MIRLGALLLLLVALVPDAAHACAVCFSGTDDSRDAFLITTGLMTFFPLLLIGGVLLWLRSLARKRDEDRRRKRELGIPLGDTPPLRLP